MHDPAHPSPSPAARLWRVPVLVLTLLLLPAQALALKVIPVPFVGANPGLPHHAYNGHPTTFKAIARDVPGGCTLQYRWNIDGDLVGQDDDWDSECVAYQPSSNNTAPSRRSANAQGWITAWNARNLSCTASLPTVPAAEKTRLFTAKIEVACGAERAFATYPVIVWAEVGQGTTAAEHGTLTSQADRDIIRAGPADEDWELDIKRNVAVDDALWFLHNRIGESGSGKAISTNWGVSDHYRAAAGVFLWSFAQNGHFPAYPSPIGNCDNPNNYDCYGEPLPRVLQDNDFRYDNDPYSEDAMRLLNTLLSQIQDDDHAVEGDKVDGVATSRIPGTSDGHSLLCRNCSTNCGGSTIYDMGHVLGGIASSGMGGMFAQVGDDVVRGRKIEFIVQQLVDHLAWAQFRGGDADGGWYYSYCGTNNSTNADFSAGQWALIGLEAADRGMKDFGVIVSDDVKYRTATTLYRNMKRSVPAHYKGGGSYRNSYNNRGNNYNVTLAGGLLVGLGWLGVDRFVPGEAGWNNAWGYEVAAYTKKQLKEDTYDEVVNYLGRAFYCPNGITYDCWNDCLFEHDTTGATGRARWGISADGQTIQRGRGNVYGMYAVQKGARTILDGLRYVGRADSPNALIDAGVQKDWYREFTYYFVNNQEVDGRIVRSWTTGTNSDDHLDDYGGTTAWGEVLTLTPTLFDPKPVPIAKVDPMTVTEGCTGSQEAIVFSHEDSYLQTPQRRVVEYQWLFDTAGKPAGQTWDRYFNDFFGVPQLVPDPGGLPPLDQYIDATGSPAQQNDAGTKGWRGRDLYAQPRKVWLTSGTYTAALRVVDDKGITEIVTVPGIRVLEQEEVAPAVVHGGPYVIRAGEELVLEGMGWDDNETCGDTLTFVWEIRDRQGNWVELDLDGAAAGRVEWAALLVALDVDDEAELEELGLLGSPISLRLLGTDRTDVPVAAPTELTIYGTRPLPCFTAIPEVVGCTEPVMVNAACTSHQDPRSELVQVVQWKWHWDYEEGDVEADAFGLQQQHGYNASGTHVIGLAVTDSLEVSEVTTKSVLVEPRRPPVANPAGPYTLTTVLDEQGVRQGGTVRLDGTRSTDPDIGQCGDRLARQEWDIDGDGQYELVINKIPVLEGGEVVGYDIERRWDIDGNGVFEQVTHTPDNPLQSEEWLVDLDWATLRAALTASGKTEEDYLARPNGLPNVPLRLRVTDASNPPRSHVALTSLTIFHNGPIPQFTVRPERAACLQPIRFNATASYHGYPPHTINVYTWDFGDGTNGVGDVLEHNYSRLGIYHPTLTVTDDQGRSASLTKEVVIQEGNNVPEVDPGGPYSIAVGDELRLDGSGTTEPDVACGDSLSTFQWYHYNVAGELVELASGPWPQDPHWTFVWGAEAPCGAGCDGRLVLEEPEQYPVDTLTGQPVVPLYLKVTDSQGGEAIGQTFLSVYPRGPVAVATWRPQPQVPVTRLNENTRRGRVELDARGSRPGDPALTLISYAWAVLEPNGQWRSVANGEQTTASIDFNNETVFPRTVRFRLTVADNDAPIQNTAAVQFDVVFAELASTPPTITLPDGNEVHIALGDPLTVRATVTDADATANPAEDWITVVRWNLDGEVDRPLNPEEIERFASDTNGDGVVNGLDEPPAAGLNLGWNELAQYGLQALGTHTIVLQVVDHKGGGTLSQTEIRVIVHDKAMSAVATAVPRLGGCTTTFTFDGSGSRHLFPGGQIVMYRWSFGDGVQASGQQLTQATHAYDRFGDFEVTLEVQDSKGRKASTTIDVSTVNGNVPPVAQIENTPFFVDSVLQGSLVLDASDSFDPDEICEDYVAVYRWDLDGDEVFDLELDGDPWSQPPVPELLWDELVGPGGYGLPQDEVLTVTLEVEDSLGSKAQEQTTLLITDGAPYALFTFEPEPSACGQQVSFDATASRHPRPDRLIASYEWDFDYDTVTREFEPSGLTGPQVRYTFPSMGTRTVALRVTDNNVPPRSTVHAMPATVSGNNLPPVASTNGDIEAAFGETLTLDASASYDPNQGCNDAPVQFWWDLNNDGNWDLQVDTPTTTRTWEQMLALLPGVQKSTREVQHPVTIRLQVWDKAGAGSVVITPRIIFFDPVPVARPTVHPDTVGCGADQFFSGAASSSNLRTRPIVRYTWDFGDGSPLLVTDQKEVKHAYARMKWESGAAVPYKAKLTVRDSNGVDSLPVEVNATLRFANRPPVAHAGGPYITSRINDAVVPVTLDASASYDPDTLFPDLPGTPCDGIAADKYEWDTDGDGKFGADDNDGSPYCQPNSDCVGKTIERFGAGANWQNGTMVGVAVRVTDAYGNQTISPTVMINVTSDVAPMVQLVTPNGGEVLAGNAPIQVNFGLVANVARQVTLAFTVNDVPVVLSGDNVEGNLARVTSNADGSMKAASFRFDTSPFASTANAYRLQVVATDTVSGKSTTVRSHRSFTIDNEAPAIAIDDNRLAVDDRNVVTWRLDVLGREVSGVRVAGTFNGWSDVNLDDEWRMRDGNGDGIYLLSHHLDDGEYAYKFVLFFPDGHKEWWLDTTNEDTVDDGYGGLNNRLELPLQYDVAVKEQVSANGTRFTLQGVSVQDGLDPAPSFTVVLADTDAAWALDRVYPLGETKIVLVARDWAGNTAYRDLGVLIMDSTAPTVTLGPPMEQEATLPGGTPVKLQPMFWDLCDTELNVLVTAEDEDGNSLVVVRNAGDGSYTGSFPLGSSTVEFTVLDDSGNSRDASITVRINDTTAPTIVLDDPMMRVAQTDPQGVPADEVLLPEPTLLDNGSAADELVCEVSMLLLPDGGGAPVLVTAACGAELPAGYHFPPGETEVTYTVTDGSGNPAETGFVVLVTDAAAPEVTLNEPRPRSDIWYAEPVEVRFTVADATDPDPDVSVNGQPIEPVGGVYTLVYSADGVYDVRINVADDQGNQSMVLVPRFGIDIGAPTVTVRDFPTEGVLLEDPTTYPLFFTGETAAPIFSAADSASGIVHVEGNVLPGTDQGALPLFSQDLATNGMPPVGRLLLNDLTCANRPNVCTNGQLRLRDLTNGVQRMVVQARDAAGNAALLEVPFKISNLEEALRVVLSHIPGYQQEYPDLAEKLEAVAEILTKGLTSLRLGYQGRPYLGNCLLSIEHALKLMETEVTFAALPALEADADLLARGSYSETRLYWEAKAITRPEETPALDALNMAMTHRRNKAYSSSILACENAYFYIRNADYRFYAVDTFSALDVAELIEAETYGYTDYVELPAYGEVMSTYNTLVEHVIPALQRLCDPGYLQRDRDFLDMLLALQDMVNDLVAAQDQDCWVRNWQWGMAQVIRVLVDIAKYATEGWVGENCRTIEANAEYVRGMSWLDNLQVDDMLNLYAEHDIRCLMLYLYIDAGYDNPPHDLTAYGCEPAPPPCPQ